MNKTGYLPSSDSDRVIWLNNFSTKISIYATNVGITAAEETSIKNDAAFFSYIENLVEVFKQTTNNIVGYRNLLKNAKGQQRLGIIPSVPTLGTSPATVAEGVFDRVSKLVARIKASVNYTDSMGQDLGIIAPTVTFDATTMQPVLKIKLDAGRPHIKCAKSFADAMDLFVDRKDGKGFVLIGRLLIMDYIDTVDLPSATPVMEWEYKAMYVIGNNNVGLMSTVESVIVKKL